MLRIYTAVSNITYALLRSHRRLLTDKRGVTAIEYGLIAGGIAVSIITLVITLGGDLRGVFSEIQTQVTRVPR